VDKTLIKGLKLLEELARSATPRSITGLAIEMDLHKSNIHRVLQTLSHCGYVMQLPDGRYAATLRLWDLGKTVSDRLDIRAVARPALEWLGRKTGADVYLTVLESLQTVYVDRLKTTRPLRPHYHLGTRLPPYCNAAGKAMLAYLDEEQVNSATVRMKRYTPTTLTTREALLQELHHIRRQGYAVNNGERESDVRGIAAPVLNALGFPIAALTVITMEADLPAERFPHVGALAIEAATQVEHILQGGPPWQNRQSSQVAG
jgi:DNA-binding IclR family transcriptional regulator